MGQTFRKKYFGTKDFYKKTLMVALPIMIQNGITNFVGLLDNIMVGQTGTEQMSGIAIVNQFFFVFNLAVFGAVAGAGIYSAQFYGKEDHEGVRYSFRFKLYICVGITALGILVLSLFGDNLIQMFLKGDDKGLSIEDALMYGKRYMKIMLLGLLPFTIEQAYSGTLRECGQTVVSMKAGIAAIVVNLILNYVLIFGKFGAPCLGVEGAAIATVVSRYVQVAVVIFWTHRHSKEMPFIVGAYKSLRIPASLAGKIIMKGLPLLVNEVLWSAGITMMNQCYSLRGLDAVAAINISSTINNLFNVAFVALGDAIAIVVGQQLGAGEFEEAKDTDRKLIVFSGLLCVGLGILLFTLAPIFPTFYNTTDEVKQLAVSFMRVAAIFIPVWGLTHAIYFTLRSGGKTFVTFLFDSVYMWCVVYTVAYLLSRKTSISVIPMYFCVQAVDIIKVIIGSVLVKKGIWINNIVS
ncbi:MAG: MATE family efflux transporter [Eubacteriales bacterium]|nr:MATE family efflux transporter [Eubacteriales bacterium]